MAKNSHLEIFRGGDFSEFAERLTFHFLASDIGKVQPSAKLKKKARWRACADKYRSKKELRTKDG